MKQAAEKISWKIPGLVSSGWVLLFSRVLSGRPPPACMHQPGNNSHVTMLESALYSMLPSGSGDRKVWAMRDWSYGKRNTGVIGYDTCSCDLFLLVLSCTSHHHHHVVPLARISLNLSRHLSLSFIASGRSSGLHPVSSRSRWMYVRAGRPAFARPYVGVHWSTSLMSSSLLLQHCPACLVRLTWIVFVMGGRWPYS